MWSDKHPPSWEKWILLGSPVFLGLCFFFERTMSFGNEPRVRIFRGPTLLPCCKMEKEKKKAAVTDALFFLRLHVILRHTQLRIKACLPEKYNIFPDRMMSFQNRTASKDYTRCLYPTSHPFLSHTQIHLTFLTQLNLVQKEAVSFFSFLSLFSHLDGKARVPLLGA